jgi:hypothetical protein
LDISLKIDIRSAGGLLNTQVSPHMFKCSNNPLSPKLKQLSTAPCDFHLLRPVKYDHLLLSPLPQRTIVHRNGAATLFDTKYCRWRSEIDLVHRRAKPAEKLRTLRVACPIIC